MSRFTPWTKLDAENEVFNRTVYGKRLSPHQQEIWLDAIDWAAVQIEKCETIYYRDSDHEERVIVASPECFELDTHEAKLVGVREVEK